MTSQVTEFLDRLGIGPGSNVFVHANVALGLGAKSEDFLDDFLEAIEGTIGSSGTVVFPAFTFSAARGDVFGVKTPVPPSMGALSRVAFDRGYRRNLDPMFGVISRGELSDHLEPAGYSSNGPEGTLGKLLDLDFTILSIGLDLGTTVLHEIEYRLGLPYRSVIEFEARIFRGDTLVKCSWKAYMRDLQRRDTAPNFLRFSQRFEHLDFVHSAQIGPRRSFAYSIRTMEDALIPVLKGNPMFLMAPEEDSG